MAITTTITALPPPPNPATDDSTTYSAKASLFTSALVTFGSQLATWTSEVNTTQGQMNASQTGSAVGITYTFSTTITASDPGSGQIRLGSATQNASTAMYVSNISSDATDWSGPLGVFTASTSVVKGYLKLHKAGDGTKWVAMTFTAMATNTGWKNFTVVVIGASSANPFINGDSVVMTFTRNGDAAAGGGAAISDIISQTQNAGTTGGTSTAYTLTPASAAVSYAANAQYWVNFHTACGNDPTLAISGLATPPNLVKQAADGSYTNIKSGDFPSNHRSRVIGLSATQYLVEEIPVPDGASNFIVKALASSPTLDYGDRGAMFVHTDGTIRNITIPANATTPLPIGFTFSVFNDTGAANTTISINTDTLLLVGSGSTGTRTISGVGLVTVTKVSSTKWVISGGGVT